MTGDHAKTPADAAADEIAARLFVFWPLRELLNEEEQDSFHGSIQTTVAAVLEGYAVTPKPICKTCNSTEWVCESHPTKPWGDAINAGPNACHCGGAGKPCPECNPLSKERRG